MNAQSPLLGFNNNIKHKGRVFHIQTEDSGVKHPHVITHLFADGGRILKTTKTSYAEHIGAADMQDTVRVLMQEQHKAMFIALRDGQYDYLFDDRAPRPAPSQPGAEQGPASGRGSVGRMPMVGGPTAVTRPDLRSQPQPEGARPAVPPARRAPSRPRLDVDPRALQAQLQRRPSPLEAAAAHAPIDLDLSALERAADEAQTPHFRQMQPDLPPPPAAVLGRKSDGRQATLTSYRSSSGSALSTGEAAAGGSPPHVAQDRMRSPTVPGSYTRSATSPQPLAGRAASPTLPLSTRPGAAQPSPRSTGGSGRYAPTRAAAIFTPKKPTDKASLFGDDLVSEKSLDEVILSYLAEDLEGAEKK